MESKRFQSIRIEIKPNGTERHRSKFESTIENYFSSCFCDFVSFI